MEKGREVAQAEAKDKAAAVEWAVAGDSAAAEARAARDRKGAKRKNNHER